MATWTYHYNDNTIVVKDLGIKGEELFVNDQLQDKKVGSNYQSNLNGRLETGEEIKVCIGGFLKPECILFVNNVLQTPIEK